MRRPLLVALLVAAALTASLLPPRLGATAPATAAAPTLTVTTVASGLALPWDAHPLPDGPVLVTERATKRLLLVEGGRARPVSYASSTVWAAGETGLMGLEVDPAFSSNRRFYTCQGGFRSGGGHDVRVMAWTLSADGLAATSSGALLTGIPATSGRHGGCRLLVTRGGTLLVGTGDAAIGKNPRDRTSLGGKVLRLDRLTGKPWRDNPFITSSSRTARYVYSYGHRNVQGLAQRRDDSLWSVEHGTTRDDEVNRLVERGDHGWQPTPGYDESKPMTDHRLPGAQRAARWRSGSPTVATSGAAWVSGSRWGSYDGTLAVAALKGQRMIFMTFDSSGRLVRTTTPSVLRSYGRLRSVTPLPGGDLLVTTANGSNDRVLRVSPS
ncbi:PQQ-dependent sugar dehydrogenase [Nocardioides aurantiacus]|uniref:Glucose/arabinose dehydrogenase n=1 Tax=Nocardioides aurantiacus TaxID=86796 RepID=A0A3N2CT07_9ACTN|nr:PQQ-dependent sugar dehydrogenase [Nocardioides aurantiacus]ROR90374.1 glucose/arabinose dehydrogenase [Nocardioides aurantiacus]